MSTTDLEDELKSSLERAAASVPPVTGLSERATAGARRAQRRTWIVSGAAAVAVAAVAVVGFGLVRSNDAPVQPSVAGGPSPSSVTPAPRPLTAQTVSGTWHPEQIAEATALSAARPNDPVLILRPDGTWRGSDGCNGLHGTYRIGQRGAFAATAGGQTMIGCKNVPNSTVLTAAKRITLEANTLRFFGADGRELGRYTRSR